jgi:hypothetical protein
MATGIPIIDTLLPSFAFDNVAVFTQEFEQLFKDARSVKATIKEQSKVMEHPLENGAVITDHRIVLPVEIELSLILKPSSYQDTYKAIRSYYLNGTLLVIQTRTGIYENQIIQAIPHEETPEQYDAVALNLSLREALFVTPDGNIAPEAPQDTTTVDRGQQGISNANATQIALAIAIFQSYGNLSGGFP